MAASYRTAGERTQKLEQFSDLLAWSIELVAISAVVVLSVGRGDAIVAAITAAFALGGIFMYPYLVPRSLTVWVPTRVPLLFVGLLGGLSLYFSGAAKRFSLPFGLADPARMVADVVWISAAAGLLATLLTAMLQRYRPNFHGYLPFQLPREEIVCELVQIIYLLNEIHVKCPIGDTEKILIVQKLGRVRYLYHTGLLMAPKPSNHADVRCGYREVAHRLKDRSDRVCGSAHHWPEVLKELRLQTAQVLLHLDGQMYAEYLKARKERRRRRRTTTGKIARVLVASLVVVGLWYVVREMGVLNGTELGGVVATLLLGFAVQLIRTFDPDVSIWSWLRRIRQYKDLYKDFQGFRSQSQQRAGLGADETSKGESVEQEK